MPKTLERGGATRIVEAIDGGERVWSFASMRQAAKHAELLADLPAGDRADLERDAAAEPEAKK